MPLLVRGDVGWVIGTALALAVAVFSCIVCFLPTFVLSSELVAWASLAPGILVVASGIVGITISSYDETGLKFSRAVSSSVASAQGITLLRGVVVI